MMASLDAPSDWLAADVLQRAQQDIEASKVLIDRYRHLPEATMRSLIGMSSDIPHASWEVYEKYLRSPNADIRVICLMLLDRLACSDPRFVSECEALATEDPESRIRGIALWLLLAKWHRIANPVLHRLITILWRDILTDVDLKLFNQLDATQSIFQELSRRGESNRKTDTAFTRPKSSEGISE